jgi:hypothetical protein
MVKSIPAPKRRPITDAVITAIENVIDHVGDNEKPDAGGWQGDPGSSAFVPYCVVVSLSTSDSQGSFEDPQGDVVFPYSLISYGISRKQCETMADDARHAAQLELTGVDVTTHKVRRVSVRTFGEVQAVRTKQDVTWYAETDVVELDLARKRGS